MMSVEKIIKSFVNDQSKELMFGINTTMTSLVPNAIYSLTTSSDGFVITQWNEDQGDAPTPNQIKREYQRQESFVEFYNYLKNDQPEVYELLMRKLGYS
jgi:hypothetical protein